MEYEFICGLDEAGRGPLAGPVTAGAVILPKDFDLSILNDSKKLSEKKRINAFNIIKENYFIYSLFEKLYEDIRI